MKDTAAGGIRATQGTFSSCFSNDDPGLTLSYFTARSNFSNLGFSTGKIENSGFFSNYCSL